MRDIVIQPSKEPIRFKVEVNIGAASFKIASCLMTNYSIDGTKRGLGGPIRCERSLDKRTTRVISAR